MSSKIGTSPSEIATAINDIPPYASQPGEDALQAALRAMTNRSPKAMTPRVIFYRFDQGHDPSMDTFQANLQSGSLPFHDVAREVDCDVQLIEIGAGEPDIDDNARACAFGMMATEEDTGVLIIVSFGAGSDLRSNAVDPDKLFETATPEITAMYGAMIAASRANIPVIAEGPQAIAAAKALRPDLRGRVFICGVDKPYPGLNIFADTEKNDKGYAAIMLAATLQTEYAKRAKAA